MSARLWVFSTPPLSPLHAGVVELAYTADLKSAARKGLWVRLPPPARLFTGGNL